MCQNASSSLASENARETLDLEKSPRRRSESSDRIMDAVAPRQIQQVEDVENLGSISLPPNEEEIAEAQGRREPDGPSAKAYSPTSLPVITSLMGTSVLGVLARLGLLSITTYEGHAIFSLAWVQGAGCLVMGLALGLKDELGSYYGPLYTAITTGFCGSLTTFSSWQLDIFTSWANVSGAHRDWFRDAIDGIGKIIFTLAISLSSAILGLHLARMLKPILPNKLPRAHPAFGYVFSLVSVLIYAATLPAYFRLSASFRHQATAALLFSFPGTLTRYVLSLILTPLLSLFPLGTFTANTSGTALLGIFHILQRTSPMPSWNACAILQGLSDGYCGCLTTVSTFAVEVIALEGRKAWLYVFLSVICSQLLLLIVLGVSWWGTHIKEIDMCLFE